MQDNLIARTILTYDDLIKILPGTDNEPLVDVRKYSPSIVAKYNKSDMLPYTGSVILVRDSVAKKLGAANDTLKTKGVRLKIVYGYRHPEIQRKYFSMRRDALHQENPKLDDEALNRLTHNFVAMPDVAGHPTGSAIDLTLINAKSDELEMGTGIADYSDPQAIRTYAVTNDTWISNRKLLHDSMVAQGFAPFYGEWWHFSYGDREWAAFYNKSVALYDTREIS